MIGFVEYCIIHSITISVYIFFAVLCVSSINEADSRKTLQYFIIANLAGIFLFNSSQVMLIAGLIIVSAIYPSNNEKQGLQQPSTTQAKKSVIKRKVQIKRRTPIRRKKQIKELEIGDSQNRSTNIDDITNITPSQTIFKALTKVSTTKLF